MLDLWGLEIEDENLTLLDLNGMVANRLVSMLPDVPVVAQHVGLGLGEVTEVQVPVGSTYAYRHIANIEQKKWKIAAIYRNGQLLLPQPSFMVRPNDMLLLVGEPEILKSVYKAIKAETGQFPAPYGRNVYFLLDLGDTPAAQAQRQIEQVIYLHDRLSSQKLHIRVIRPDQFDVLKVLREIDRHDVVVDVAYREFELEKELLGDLTRCKAGLVVVNRSGFEQPGIRKMLYRSKKAVLCLGQEGLETVGRGVILLSKNPNLEKISSPFFDVTTQLNLMMSLYHLDPGGSREPEVMEHFENLANIYAKEMEIVEEEEVNPIRGLMKEQGILQFIPFEKSIVTAGSWMDFFRPSDLERHYRLLAKFNQLFLPVM